MEFTIEQTVTSTETMVMTSTWTNLADFCHSYLDAKKYIMEGKLEHTLRVFIVDNSKPQPENRIVIHRVFEFKNDS